VTEEVVRTDTQSATHDRGAAVTRRPTARRSRDEAIFPLARRNWAGSVARRADAVVVVVERRPRAAGPSPVAPAYRSANGPYRRREGARRGRSRRLPDVRLARRPRGGPVCVSSLGSGRGQRHLAHGRRFDQYCPSRLGHSNVAFGGRDLRRRSASACRLRPLASRGVFRGVPRPRCAALYLNPAEGWSSFSSSRSCRLDPGAVEQPLASL